MRDLLERLEESSGGKLRFRRSKVVNKAFGDEELPALVHGPWAVYRLGPHAPGWRIMFVPTGHGLSDGFKNQKDAREYLTELLAEIPALVNAKSLADIERNIVAVGEWNHKNRSRWAYV